MFIISSTTARLYNIETDIAFFSRSRLDLVFEPNNLFNYTPTGHQAHVWLTQIYINIIYTYR